MPAAPLLRFTRANARIRAKGIPFDLAREGGHSNFRVVHAEDLTGREIQRALIEARSALARDLGALWLTSETNPDTAEGPNLSRRNMLRCGFEELFQRPQYVKG